MSRATQPKSREAAPRRGAPRAATLRPVAETREPAGRRAGARARRQVYDSVLDLVPGPDNPTPMVRVGARLQPNPDFELLVKLEGFNPFGSIKDRAARAMLAGVTLGEGQALVEPSSGNTGIALAALANAAGIPIEIAVPEAVPDEKKAMLRLLGAKLWEAPDDLCPLFPSEGARGLVKGIVESPRHRDRYVSPDQYENPLNVEAHYTTTGPEIWSQTGGDVDYFFAGFGTCGTITGVGRYLKERNPAVRIVGVEPARRDHNLPGMKRITGLSDDLVPRILDRTVIDEVVAVEDDDAYAAAVRLARSEGLLVGPTTGAVLHAALEVAAGRRGTAVVISPDGAFKYASSYAAYLRRVGDLAADGGA